jgi:hypothetical protein
VSENIIPVSPLDVEVHGTYISYASDVPYEGYNGITALLYWIPSSFILV